MTREQSLSQEVGSGDEGLGLDGRIEDDGLLKRRGRTLAAWSEVLDILEDKECSWFKGLANDSPKVKWMRRVYPGVTTRRHRGRVCISSLVKAFLLQGRHSRFVGDSTFLVVASSGFERITASRSVGVEYYLTRLLKDSPERTNIEREIKRERERQSICLQESSVTTPKHSA